MKEDDNIWLAFLNGFKVFKVFSCMISLNPHRLLMWKGNTYSRRAAAEQGWAGSSALLKVTWLSGVTHGVCMFYRAGVLCVCVCWHLSLVLWAPQWCWQLRALTSDLFSSVVSCCAVYHLKCKWLKMRHTYEAYVWSLILYILSFY